MSTKIFTVATTGTGRADYSQDVAATVQSRALYLDRNPKLIAGNFGDPALAPHALTSRWQYVVPVGRSTQIEVVSTQTVRVTAAGALGGAAAYISVISSRDGVNVQAFSTYLFDNAIGAADRQDFNGTLILLAGDILRAYTYDFSTGGTVAQVLEMKGTEFDA